MYYFIACNKGNRNLYMKLHYTKLVEVTDQLFDNGFKVTQITEWQYNEMRKKQSNGIFDIDNGQVYDLRLNER